MPFNIQALKKITDYLYEIPAGYLEHMRLPARIYADEEILAQAASDRSLDQLANVAWLPGAVCYALAMPDIHEGYGFPIGGVAATDMKEGVISPGGVGYDINCGVRLITTNLDAAEIAPVKSDLMDAISSAIPAGLGKGGDVRLKKTSINDPLDGGAQWAVSAGFGDQDDVTHCEENGRMPWARAEAVSSRAKERGIDQLGTLGSGNHFIELNEVLEVYDEAAANAYDLRPGQLVAQIHSGSRGLGHQVCTDYVRAFQGVARREGLTLPDRELVCAPIDSQEGRDYLAAMSAAANFAWANRQVMTDSLRQALEAVLVPKGHRVRARVLYDVAHNVAKIERHYISGKKMELCVHRKGATRAFPPGHESVPFAYRGVGQPVLVPGDMGTGSYVLHGTEMAMKETFGSCCHGAGRLMSRSAARKQVNARELREVLAQQGVVVRAASNKGLAEEAPDAYKDVHRVVDVVHNAGLAPKVALLRPLGVVKG